MDIKQNWLASTSKIAGRSLREEVLVKSVRQRGIDSTGVDSSIIRTKIAQNQVGSNVIALANGEALPFDRESFNVATNRGSLAHSRISISGFGNAPSPASRESGCPGVAKQLLIWWILSGKSGVAAIAQATSSCWNASPLSGNGGMFLEGGGLKVKKSL